ncbi:MAG: nicotinamide riboside transporter PnuC [Bacteroidota bacterium]
MEIVQNVWASIVEMNWIVMISVLAAIAYVVLAARGNIWCWAFGIVSAILWAYAAVVFYDLYVDGILQVYYVGMGFYGWHQWRGGGSKQKALPIQQLKWRQHFMLIALGSVLTLVVGYFFGTYTAAAATYLDAFTTVFSIITTVLVARKILGNWLYWIVIDMTYVYLYGIRGGYLYALLNVVYVLVAVVGYWNWLKKMKVEG